MKNNKFKNKVLSEIKQSKVNAETVADRNLQKALLNEEFKTSFKEIRNINFEIAKKEFLNQSVQKEKNDLEIYKNKIKTVMQNLKINKNDLIPNYSCKKCCDTGIVGDKYCSCFYKKLNKEIINNLGIKIDVSHTFSNSNFEIFDDPIGIKKMYDKIYNWCVDLNSSKYKNLLLCGAPGVGKTYLVDCICNELINQNFLVNYYTAFSLSDLFLKYKTSFAENRSGLLDGILNCDVLIIDDLGAEPNIKNTEEYFYSIINERLSKNKSTIITTNLNLDQILSRYGERTFSRLCNKSNSILLKMNNSDLRMRKR